MNRLILCEVKTDALLLGYYLMKVAGWEHEKRGPKGLDIKASEHNEIVSWYTKADEYRSCSLIYRRCNFIRVMCNKEKKRRKITKQG